VESWDTGHDRHKHCKRRLFDYERISRYGHERGVFILVIGKSFQEGQRVGKAEVMSPLAVREAHTGGPYVLAYVHMV